MEEYTKEQIQKMVKQNGEPLSLDKFIWDNDSKTFSTKESNLVLNFEYYYNFTFITGDNCSFKTESYCHFKTGEYCSFKTGSNCTFKTIYACTFDTGSDCTFKTENKCTFDTGSDCTFDTGFDCTFDTGYGCTFDTGSDCTFKTGSNCTFDTGSDCTFKTENNCTFDTLSDCTFNAGNACIFKTKENCVIVNRSFFEVIVPKKDDIIQICPEDIEGHLVNGIHSITGKISIIADGILSEIISKKGNVYKVKNNGEEKISYLLEAERDGKKVYSHGNTLRECKRWLIYKLSNRDTSKYKNLTLETVLTKEDAIQCYMTITGACDAGTKYFIDNLDKVKSEYSVKEIIEITNGQYGNSKFQYFINSK
jgi:hypothetical protein